MKYILIVIALYLIYLVMFSKKKNLQDENSQNMIECASCSLFFDQKEAFIKDGQFFCSKECMEKKC